MLLVLLLGVALSVPSGGCGHLEEEPSYLGGKRKTSWYRKAATSVAYSNANQNTPDWVV